MRALEEQHLWLRVRLLLHVQSAQWQELEDLRDGIEGDNAEAIDVDERKEAEKIKRRAEEKERKREEEEQKELAKEKPPASGLREKKLVAAVAAVSELGKEAGKALEKAEKAEKGAREASGGAREALRQVVLLFNSWC